MIGMPGVIGRGGGTGPIHEGFLGSRDPKELVRLRNVLDEALLEDF